MGLPNPHLAAIKSPQFKLLAIAGGAILLLGIALWSVTRSKIASGPLAASTPNGLNADASGSTPSVIVMPPRVGPILLTQPVGAAATDTPPPPPAPPPPSSVPDPVTSAPPPPPPPAPAPVVAPAPAPVPAPAPAPVANPLPGGPDLGGQWYQVQKGDTLSSIAARYGVSTTSLGTLNQAILNLWSGKSGTTAWNYVYPGQWLKIR
jgi:hypothetical protein